MTTPACGNCKWMQIKGKYYDQYRACTRFPPKPAMLRGDSGLWPVVQESESCGEFAAKEDREEAYRRMQQIASEPPRAIGRATA